MTNQMLLSSTVGDKLEQVERLVSAGKLESGL